MIFGCSGGLGPLPVRADRSQRCEVRNQINRFADYCPEMA
jgi:hypothetical protein